LQRSQSKSFNRNEDVKSETAGYTPNKKLNEANSLSYPSPKKQSNLKTSYEYPSALIEFKRLTQLATGQKRTSKESVHQLNRDYTIIKKAGRNNLSQKSIVYETKN
jgi:hypothetical protein